MGETIVSTPALPDRPTGRAATAEPDTFAIVSAMPLLPR
jgi:hypothetical protein